MIRSDRPVLVLEYRRSLVGDFWRLRRLADGHTEASSFATSEDAIAWGEARGFEVRGIRP